MQSYKKSPYFSKNKYEMTEEREIVGFVLPLAAGIAVCTFIAHPFSYRLTGSLALFCIIAACWAAGYWRGHRPAVLLLTFFLAFSTGVFCQSTSSMRFSPSLKIIRQANAEVSPTSLPEAAAAKTAAAIRALPFKHPGTDELLCAFILGDKSGLEKETQAQFRDSGAAHLLALSGLHLGIIYVLVLKTLSLLGRSRPARWIRYFLLIAAAGFYTLATGASPSLVRAFLFIVLRETSKLFHRPQAPAQILMAALTIQLILTPKALFSAGFQLSYLAVAGIIYLWPPLRRCWPGDPAADHSWMRRVWDSTSLSISCQLTTGPLAWIRFGTLPGHFLLTNLIAIPLTGLLIPLAIGTLLLSQLGFCPELLYAVVDVLAEALQYSLRIISIM